MIAKVRIIFQIAMKKREKLLADALFSCKMQSRGTSEGEFRRQWKENACRGAGRRLLWEEPTLAVGKADACCGKSSSLLWEKTALAVSS